MLYVEACVLLLSVSLPCGLYSVAGASLFQSCLLGGAADVALLCALAFQGDVICAWFALRWLSWCVGLRRTARLLAARQLGLRPPLYVVDTTTVHVSTDGHVLAGTLHTPRGQPGPFPTVLIRTPYGRAADFGQEVLAERGYAVLVQDTRGRFGSGGQFVPVSDELADGAATIRWLRRQPWYNGRLGCYGISYLGFTAWACAGGDAGDEVDVCVSVISQSRVRSAVFAPGGAFGLEVG